MRSLLTVAVVSAGVLCFAAPAGAVPNMGLSSASASPTGSVTFLASGFDTGARVDVFFDTTEVALATTNASGAVGASITIPPDAQPGTHWITVDETRTHAATQAPVSVSTDWSQGGYGPSWREFNPLENTINTGNVHQLTEAWSTPVTQYGNEKPFVFYQGGLYAVDEDGKIHAYSAGGALRWTATPPPPDSVIQPSPAAGNGHVVFATGDGNVRAYNSLCRTDGGSCSPVWSRNIGTRIGGGLTIRNGLVYVPGADAHIHVLNLATGAPGTDLVAIGTSGLSSPVAFSPDGTAFVAAGNSLQSVSSNGKSNISYGGAVSTPAVGNEAAYVTSSDGYLHEVFGWTTPIGSGCDTAPAYADNVVYAAGCGSLGAYDAGTGSPLWTINTPGSAYAVSVANGVLYACLGGQLVAYAASYGARLWTGGYCAGRPMIVNGTLYATTNDLSAYTLAGATTTSRPSTHAQRPNPRRLHRSARFRRKLAAEQRRARRHRHARTPEPAGG